MAPSIPTALLALLLCAPLHAQPRTGQVTEIPSGTSVNGVGAAPSASLAPASALSGGSLKLGPALTAPAPNPVVQLRIASIERFRALTGEAALLPAQRAALEAAAPAVLLQAQAEAAAALIAHSNPAYDSRITPESRFTDSPAELEYKKTLAEARVVVENARQAGLQVGALRSKLSVDGKIDAGKLERAYDGSALLKGLPKALAEDPALAEHVRDGAPKPALARLAYLQQNHPELRERAGKAAVELLRTRIARAGSSPTVLDLNNTLKAAESFLGRRQYGLALEAGRRMLAALKMAGIGDLTRRALAMEAYALMDTAKDRGGPALYGRMGEYKSAELLARVRELQRRDPGAYVGDPLSGEPIRVQCYGDCAVQQAYNHPRLAALVGQLPYLSFLSAVEAQNGTKVRKEGLAVHDTRFLLHLLGLEAVRQPAPDGPEALAAILREHGALMVTVSWHAPQALRGGDHAVLLQGAFREDGQWRFVVIDSNHSRPQLFSYLDLQVLSPSEYASVEPLAVNSPYMPKVMRAIADPELRLRAGAHDFIQRFGVLRPHVPWWKRALFGALNAVRARMGLDEAEPEPDYELDPNAIPIGKVPQAVKNAVQSGMKLPPEALLKGPDGKTYLNRMILERMLQSRK